LQPAPRWRTIRAILVLPPRPAAGGGLGGYRGGAAAKAQLLALEGADI
jgi:hypothetical protein